MELTCQQTQDIVSTSDSDICMCLSTKEDLSSMGEHQSFFIRKKPVMSWKAFVCLLEIEQMKEWMDCVVCRHRWNELSIIACADGKPLLFRSQVYPWWLQNARHAFLKSFQNTPVDLAWPIANSLRHMFRTQGGFVHIHTESLVLFKPSRNISRLSTYALISGYRLLKKTLAINRDDLLTFTQNMEITPVNLEIFTVLRTLIEEKATLLNPSKPKSHNAIECTWLISRLTSLYAHKGHARTTALLEGINKLTYAVAAMESKKKRMRKRVRDQLCTLIDSVGTLNIDKNKKRRRGTDIDTITNELSRLF